MQRSLRWNELLERLRKQAPRGAYAFCGPEAFLKQEAQQARDRNALCARHVPPGRG
jgi:hypothetical protein